MDKKKKHSTKINESVAKKLSETTEKLLDAIKHIKEQKKVA